MATSAEFYETHDSITQPTVDCRVNLTIGQTVVPLQLNIPKDNLPANYGAADLLAVLSTEFAPTPVTMATPWTP